jgi:hypothetical protein
VNLSEIVRHAGNLFPLRVQFLLKLAGAKKLGVEALLHFTKLIVYNRQDVRW